MSNPWLEEFDEIAHAEFSAVGLADTGTYFPPGSEEGVTARIYQDDGVQVIGENADVVTQQTRIGILRADVDAPEEGGRIVISPGKGSITYTLDALQRQDSSMTWWEVIRG